MTILYTNWKWSSPKCLSVVIYFEFQYEKHKKNVLVFYFKIKKNGQWETTLNKPQDYMFHTQIFFLLTVHNLVPVLDFLSSSLLLTHCYQMWFHWKYIHKFSSLKHVKWRSLFHCQNDCSIKLPRLLLKLYNIFVQFKNKAFIKEFLIFDGNLLVIELWRYYNL